MSSLDRLTERLRAATGRQPAPLPPLPRVVRAGPRELDEDDCDARELGLAAAVADQFGGRLIEARSTESMIGELDNVLDQLGRAVALARDLEKLVAEKSAALIARANEQSVAAQALVREADAIRARVAVKSDAKDEPMT